MRTLKDLQSKNLRRRRGQNRHAAIERQPAHPRADHQSLAHAQGGHHEFEAFARDILQSITEKPISFEVFSDEFPEMRRQALKINGLGEKCLCQNSHHQHARRIVAAAHPRTGQRRREAQHHRHAHRGTGAGRRAGVASQGAGRRFRVCRSHRRHRAWIRFRSCASAKKSWPDLPQAELLWASVREVLNIFQADECGCEIVTVPHDILNKALKLVGIGSEGNVARHRENVCRRREGGGIFVVI